MKMFKAVLFDLDGTLLNLNVDDFLPKYIKALSIKVKDYIPMEIFPKYLLDSTYVMVKNNDETKTNEDVFMEHFFSVVEHQRQELQPIFDRFYLEDFPKLGEGYVGNPHAKNIIEHCKAKGLKIVLATNPVFPRAAVEERVRWVGLKVEDFDLITSYEEMHFCKPNINYYKEILDKISVEPHEAIMVGNDCQEDMVASEIGLKTFLVEGFIIDKGTTFKVDYKGELTDLLNIL